VTTAGQNRPSTAGSHQPPRVSVVLPVHKSEAYLAAAVESVLAQSFGDWELLAIDDGLSDKSSAILRSFAASDPRVRVILDAGAPFVMKLARGLALAQGELIARMDADDIAHGDRFARQVAFLDAHPEVAVVGSAVTLIDAHGRAIRDAQYPESPAAVAESLLTGSALAHPAVMMRKDAVIAVGGYRPAYQYAEDYDLWLRMAERYALANLPDRLLYYRQHGAKLSIVYAAEQRLATRIAQFAACCRRAGKPDPTEGLTTLSPRDLGRFELSPHQISSTVLDVADAYLAEHARAVSSISLDRVLECLAQVDRSATAHSRLLLTILIAAWKFVRAGRLHDAMRLFARALAVRGALPVMTVLMKNRLTRLLRSLYLKARGIGATP
jgi:Glycosyl transferase family 2